MPRGPVEPFSHCWTASRLMPKWRAIFSWVSPRCSRLSLIRLPTVATKEGWKRGLLASTEDRARSPLDGARKCNLLFLPSWKETQPLLMPSAKLVAPPPWVQVSAFRERPSSNGGVAPPVGFCSSKSSRPEGSAGINCDQTCIRPKIGPSLNRPRDGRADARSPG